MMSKSTIVLTLCAVVAGSSLAFATEPATSGAAVKAKPAAHHSTAAHHLSKNDTMAVQNALAKAGVYKGKADGAWGAETSSALKEYQKTNGLKVTGMADHDTLAKLGVTLSAPAPAAPTVSTPTKTPR